MRRTAAHVPVRLRVDPLACEGIGLCAQIAADAVELDRWGYPVLGARLDPGDVGAARRAARACPRKALWIENVDDRR